MESLRERGGQDPMCDGKLRESPYEMENIDREKEM